MPRIEQLAEGVTLYLGDCREILPILGKVDVVVTDPPFNVGKDFQNDNLTDLEWTTFCSEISLIFSNVNAVNYLIEVGKTDAEMRKALDRVLRYRSAIILNYTNSMRQGPIGYSDFGLVYWYGEKCFKRYKDRIDSHLESTLGEFSHPSPKQIRHYSRLIDMFSLRGNTICDPFMGSGTTGVAAVRLKRYFIGIEVEQKYFEISCKRISEALKQPDMFVEQPKPMQKAFNYEQA